MTPFPYSIATSASLADARAMMVEHEVRHLPVTEGLELKGILTDRDLKFFMGPFIGAPEASTLMVRDAYIEDCYIVDMSTPLVEVLKTMAQRHIGATVITSNNRLAGIFTATDACRVLAEQLAESPQPL
jgi:acetoin utilization protein AcuB